jgi:hypothetical protein
VIGEKIRENQRKARENQRATAISLQSQEYPGLCATQEHSGNIQGTLREQSGNIQGTFREHSGNINGTLREH